MTLAADARGIVRAALAAVDPARAVRGALRTRREGISLPGGRRVPLGPGASVHLLALGKAAGAMTDAAVAVLGPRFAGGMAVIREGSPAPQVAVEVLRGEHPVPGPGSERAARSLLAYASRVPASDAVLFLISGGGSAIAEAPAPGLRGRDLARATEVLLRSGAPIQAMNVVRRHLSAIKGGRLAGACTAGAIATLAISDVVGDAPEDIASGPTVADPTTYAEALTTARRLGFHAALPARVRRHLKAGSRGRRPETIKPGDPRLARGSFAVIASNRTAATAAVGEARRRGYRTELLTVCMTGETRDIGRLFGELLAERARAGPRPACLVAGGETTVTITGRAGRGGRNQEFVLAAAGPLRGLPAVRLLSVGTDGIDGPTDAAGGWVDGRTVDRAARSKVDLAAALATHSSYDALRAMGGRIRTGPTGTNVTDLHLGLAGAPVTRRDRGRSSPPRGAASSRRRRS